MRLSGGNVVLRSNLIADNLYRNTAIELNFVNAEILATHIWQPGLVKYLNIGGGPEAITRCVFSDSASTTWPVSAQGVFYGDPVFRQRYLDYRIFPVNGNRISGVVDRCLPAQLQSSFAGVADLLLDAQGAARNTDLAPVSNGPGPIDIGPYEVQEYPGELIFRDGFEVYL